MKLAFQCSRRDLDRTAAGFARCGRVHSVQPRACTAALILVSIRSPRRSSSAACHGRSAAAGRTPPEPSIFGCRRVTESIGTNIATNTMPAVSGDFVDDGGTNATDGERGPWRGRRAQGTRARARAWARHGHERLTSV